MSLGGALRRRFNQWVAPANPDSIEEPWRCRLLLESLLASTVVAALVAVVFATMGLKAEVDISVGLSLMCLALFWWVRRGGSYRVAARVVLTCATGGFFVGARLDPVPDPVLWAWFATIPVLAATILGRRSVWTWALLAGSAVVLSAWLDHPHAAGLVVDAPKQQLRAAGLGLIFFVFAWRLEAERQKAVWTMASVDTLKRRLMVNFSHELKTPMNGILGSAEVLAGTGLTDTQREAVATIQEAAQSLSETLEDLVDLALLDEHRLGLTLGHVDLRELVSGLGQSFEPLALARGLCLEVEIDGSVPACVRADEKRLRQVLSKLVHNALRFTETGSVRLRIVMEGNATRFEVVDTGVGIAAAQVPRLFSRFEQSDGSSTRKAGGAGLGLVISRQLVELMGGRLQVVTAPGRGARFWFDVALLALAPAPPGVAPTLMPLAAAPPEAPPRRVLIVEDNPLNARVVVALVQKLGFETRLAVNGQEALVAMEREPFLAVLMDCHMPVMDGFEATRRIRQLAMPRGRTRIVALTAGSTPDELRACLQVGMDEALTKPATLAMLARALGVEPRAAPPPSS